MEKTILKSRQEWQAFKKSITSKDSGFDFENETKPNTYPCIVMHSFAEDLEFGNFYSIGFCYPNDFPSEKSPDSMMELYYIRTYGYVGNSFVWWGEKEAGYTADLKKAGKYTRDEAETICKRRPEQDIAYLCEEIDNSNGVQLHFDSQFSNEIAPVSFTEPNGFKRL